MKRALTIGGSDPTGGAGIQADLKTFQALDVYGLSVPAALTAQNTEGVTDVYGLPAVFVSRQIDTLLSDIRPDSVKTGMLHGAETVRVISQKAEAYSLTNIVVDPVAVSSSGVRLLEDSALSVMRNELFPRARVITPNADEAALFAGRPVRSRDDMKEAAVVLKTFGPECVIITGGHLPGDPVDLLFDGDDFLCVETRRLEGHFHGTGCIFSSVVTASLALGYDPREALVKASDFLQTALRSAVSVGRGMKVLNI